MYCRLISSPPKKTFVVLKTNSMQTFTPFDVVDNMPLHGNITHSYIRHFIKWGVGMKLHFCKKNIFREKTEDARTLNIT